MSIRAILLLLFSALGAAQTPVKIKIDGLTAPLSVPTILEWSEPMSSPFSAWQGHGVWLQKSPTLFQAQPGEPASGFCALLPAQQNNSEIALSGMPAADVFRFRKESGRLFIDEAGQPALAFVFEPQLPADVPEDRRRAVYIHPIYDPLQQIMTDDFPKDHYHHRGLSWMWPRITVAGEEYNLWEMHGDIHQVFEKWLVKETGPIAAILGVKNKWLVQNRKVMDEWVWLRVFRSNEGLRIIDLRISLRPLTEISLQGQKEKGYGGLSFRFAPRDSTVILAPDGPERQDSNDRRNIWTDLSARFLHSDNRSGVAILQHPANPGAPAEWCIRAYGFLGVSWPGLAKITLPAEKTITFRFRIIVHCGEADGTMLDKIYEQFIHTPQIRFIKN